jgi:D-beta-D-heptose 7-phosphate kinase/D-beta-D-heptose 1-phosphate adenosyltransferase
VVDVREETKLLGGAANVVHNLANLGGRVYVTGLIGNDSAGRDLVHLLRRNDVLTDGLIVEQDRPTAVKTRIIAHNQQVVRFDRERRSPVQEDSRQHALSYVEKHLEYLDAIIISDYGKGMITLELMDSIRSLRSSKDIPVIVDPKVNHTNLYRHVTMITPNQAEASQMLGIEIRDEETLTEAGRILMERLECQTVLITRGKQGMSLFQQEGWVVHIPTMARRVYDVTGAGDTVIATIALGLAVGLSSEEAALLANFAAGIVVGEVGTAAVSSDQLLAITKDGHFP